MQPIVMTSSSTGQTCTAPPTTGQHRNTGAPPPAPPHANRNVQRVHSQRYETSKPTTHQLSSSSSTMPINAHKQRGGKVVVAKRPLPATAVNDDDDNTYESTEYTL